MGQHLALWAPLLAICFLVTACAVIAILAVPMHSSLRGLLRPWFLKSAERGMRAVLGAQELRNPLLSAAVKASSLTVGWGYYLTGLPMLLWIMDFELGLQSTWLMFAATWIGNGLKDLLCAPRPLDVATGANKRRVSKCIPSVDEAYAKEYGAPSTHTMNSLAMNLYLVLALASRGVVPSRHLPLLITAAGVWSAWMAFGRVYSALHTPGDTFLGYILGLALAVVWSAVDEPLLRLVRGSAWAPAFALMFCTAALLLYPTPITKPTPCHDQVASFAGVAFGGLLGVKFCADECLAKISLTSFELSALTAPLLLAMSGKLLVGGAMLLAALEGSRPLARILFGFVAEAMPLWLREMCQPPVYANGHLTQERGPKIMMHYSGRPADIEVAARFASYGMVGFFAIFGPNTLYCALGWS